MSVVYYSLLQFCTLWLKVTFPKPSLSFSAHFLVATKNLYFFLTKTCETFSADLNFKYEYYFVFNKTNETH